MINVLLFCYDEKSFSIDRENSYLYSFKEKSDNI